MAGIQRFGRLLSKKQKAKLGFIKHNTPALGTLTETMKAVDAVALQSILSQAMHKGKTIQQISIDGKTIFGLKSPYLHHKVCLLYRFSSLSHRPE